MGEGSCYTPSRSLRHRRCDPSRLLSWHRNCQKQWQARSKSRHRSQSQEKARNKSNITSHQPQAQPKQSTGTSQQQKAMGRKEQVQGQEPEPRGGKEQGQHHKPQATAEARHNEAEPKTTLHSEMRQHNFGNYYCPPLLSHQVVGNKNMLSSKLPSGKATSLARAKVKTRH